MSTLKKLAGETVLYGVSSILGRLINWLMVPLHTIVFSRSEYGIQTYLMGLVAVCMVLLTFGLETGFFRFASNKTEQKNTVYSTLMTFLLISSGLFILLCFLFLHPLSEILDITDRPYFILLLAVTLGIDVYSSIPFAKLRLDNRPLRFAIIKLVNISINVISNLFFLLLCPYLLKEYPDLWIGNLYQQEVGIGYVFISYFIASLVTFLLLTPELKTVRFSINKRLFKQILKYSFPVMAVGLASQLNLNFDKIAMKDLLRSADAFGSLGEYSAGFKLGVLMTLFTQAYRYAFEPFFFSNNTNNNSKILYAKALKYFIIIGLLAFLGVVFYLDWIQYLIGENFRGGIVIVPYVLLANLFLGIYYSLSLWYKLTDKTYFGAYMAIGGSILTILLNIILVPQIGYMGAAYAFLVPSFLMTLISFFLGQKYYPVPYDTKRILFYFTLAMGLFILSQYIVFEGRWNNTLFRTGLIIIFLFIATYREEELSRIFLKRKK